MHLPFRATVMKDSSAAARPYRCPDLPSAPVDAVRAELAGALEHGNAVLSAPPGAGKSSRVPLWLLEAPWLEGRKILLLEPRRVAARALARYAARLLGEDVARKVRETTLAIYEAGRAYAASRGIIVADTKFEFGFVDGELRLIDEVLTPDSSRFWPADQYEPGRSQPSFDKQYLRDWLTAQPWDMQPPAPALPAEVVDATAQRYREAYHILTGKEFTI